MMGFWEMPTLVRNSYQKMTDEKNTAISESVLEVFQRLKKDHLEAFVGVRTQKDLRTPKKNF
jgi:hypothetical protein